MLDKLKFILLSYFQSSLDIGEVAESVLQFRGTGVIGDVANDLAGLMA
jgi:hypothetical protein